MSRPGVLQPNGVVLRSYQHASLPTSLRLAKLQPSEGLKQWGVPNKEIERLESTGQVQQELEFDSAFAAGGQRYGVFESPRWIK